MFIFLHVFILYLAPLEGKLFADMNFVLFTSNRSSTWNSTRQHLPINQDGIPENRYAFLFLIIRKPDKIYETLVFLFVPGILCHLMKGWTPYHFLCVCVWCWVLSPGPCACKPSTLPLNYIPSPRTLVLKT
jgi:hypothetical protein